MRSRAPLVAVTLAVLLAGCSGDGDDAAGPPTPGGPPPTVATTTTTTVPVTYTVTAAELVGPDGGSLPDDVAAEATRTAERWLDAAVLTPLRTGAVPPDIDVVATGAVQERLRGPDRAALVDEAVAPPGPVTAQRAELGLTGLVGEEGPVAVVVARFVLDLTAGTDLHLVRDGELVLVPAGGGWLVDGYSMSVTREAVVPAPAPVAPPPAATPGPTVTTAR